MPIRRPKACVNCRSAKAGCSLSVPCVRCAKRRLKCEYASAQPRPQNRGSRLRPIRPADGPAAKAVLSSASESGQIDERRIMDSGLISLPSAAGGTSDSDAYLEGTEADRSTGLRTHRNTRSSHIFASSDLLPSLSDLPGSTDTLSRQSPDLQIAQAPDSASSCPSFGDLLDFDFDLTIPSSPTSDLLREFLRSESLDPVSSTKLFLPQLSHRDRSIEQGLLTAKMLFSRLASYTHMMADPKDLPPFIYPPCCLGSGTKCPMGSAHRCLPEALTVCANLTHLFYSHSPESRGFVWQQLRTHVHEMRDEFESYDKEGKLQALQAAMLYGILCAQCQESMFSDDSTLVVETIETFAEEIYDLCAWVLNADELCSSRREWTFVESLRRIGSLLYLFDLLLQINTQTPSKGDCSEFFDIPLPCHRDLWQPISDEDWKARYLGYINTRNQKERQGLTLRHLLSFRQSLVHGQGRLKFKDTSLVEEFAEWCGKVDDFSMLLWLAPTVEGEGQSRISSES